MRALPLPVAIAMLLLAIRSLTNFLSLALALLVVGKPTALSYLLVVVGVLGLIGARGLWMPKRWAMWWVIIVCAKHPHRPQLPHKRYGNSLPRHGDRRGDLHHAFHFGHRVGGAAELAAGLHLTVGPANFGEFTFHALECIGRFARRSS